MFEKINTWYKQGLWTAEMVNSAAAKGVIKKKEAKAIIGPIATKTTEPKTSK
jgi:hypothetical protein